MASPLKSAIFLTRTHLSPKSAKLLSPLQNKADLSPLKSRNFITPHLQKRLTKQENNQIFTPTKGLVLDSPHKKNLLNYGLSKQDLLYVLGRGSFGTVVKGLYKGETVALKLIKLKDNDKINDCNARKLIHKNIIKIIDILMSDKYCLVIMEFHTNSTNLQNILNELNDGLNDEIVINYSRDITQGLRYCHENCIMHLDLKPKNILLCDSSVCKICDFGNSMNEYESAENFKFQGTIAYTAPEILKGCKPTPKCDVYSLGILIWQLLSNRNPYEFLDNEVIIYKVVKFNFRPPLDSKNNQLATLCSDCWSENPDLRPNCAQICDFLSRL